MKLEFISYDGEYPNFCSGTLVMKLNDKTITFPDNCLIGGSVCGFWSIDKFPENFPEGLKEQAQNLAHDNIEHGCCEGCADL